MELKEMKESKTIKRAIAACVIAMTAAGAFAQAAGGSFLKDQAVAEMQRVSAQVDIMASNQEELSERIRKAESMKSEIDGLRAEIASLKSAMAEMRREMQSQRGEIVQDLSKKIASMQPPAPKQTEKPKPVYSGPCYEYTVQSGDTLSLIARAFGTTVQKIKELNGMKSDTLRIGQKITIQKE
jgi:LysM repeat protein